MQYIVVFDTNILISALFSSNGKPSQCLALAKMKQVKSVTCEQILNEFSEKLILKFKFSAEMAQTAVNQVRSFSQIVEITSELKAVLNDPDDDMVIECAVIGKATHIITGDKQILSLQKYQKITILKAAEFLLLSFYS